MTNDKKIIIHTDGGSRGNPGPAAIGVVIDIDGTRVYEHGEYIGDTTNNVAEYTAVLHALTWLLSSNHITSHTTISCILDSELVVRQLTGIYKIKDEKMKQLASDIRIKMMELHVPILFTSVRREQNKDADVMVNQALDNR